MKVLLLGASGFIGQRVAAALEAAGHVVLRAGRGGPVRVDLADVATDWPRLLRGVDVVVNAAGVFREQGGAAFTEVHALGPARLFDACVAAGVARVVQLSALGAAGGDDAAAAPAFLHTKHLADRHLLSLPLAATVLRPSLVFGPEGASTRWFLALAALPLVPLPGGGAQRIQPVHVDDVVAAIVAASHRDDGGGPDERRIDLVGRAPLTLRAYLESLRSQLGLPAARVWAVPRPLVHLAARAGERWPKALPMLAGDSLRMLEAGSVGDASALTRLIGRAPRPVAAFVPAALAPLLRRQAQLDWALPMLRGTLAAVWIWTGIVSLGLHPVADSLALLDRAGVPQSLALPALWSAAALDLVFGVLTLSPLPRRARLALWAAQAALIAGYTLIITLRLPEYWLHPYGPLTKNLPMLGVLWLLWSMDRARR